MKRFLFATILSAIMTYGNTVFAGSFAIGTSGQVQQLMVLVPRLQRLGLKKLLINILSNPMAALERLCHW